MERGGAPTHDLDAAPDKKTLNGGWRGALTRCMARDPERN
jgi:hypothetical protein